MQPTHIAALAAETHPPAYLIHKYWARKPHNILSAIFRTLQGSGPSLLVDPFCGAGVALSEAARLGYDCVGADVNPTAVAVTQITLSPPDPALFLETVLPHLDAVERSHRRLYDIGGKVLRYAVHATVVGCPRCRMDIVSQDAQKRGRTYRCPHCGDRLNFNLEHLRSTHIVQVTTSAATLADPRLCREQEEHSRTALHSGERFDRRFVTNRRVLAFTGMSTRHLFTDRNFSCLSELAERFHGIRDERLKDAALTLLTSAAAQCSRLIPYRNDLTTGGQAWTVPGFWVPPLHLETYPIFHVRARLKKLLRGLSDLREFTGRVSKPHVHYGTAIELLQKLAVRKRKADVVFLDPPYGDSIPYVEFSAMWNSFLDRWPNADDDLSVTGRLPKATSWERYEDGLRAVLTEVSNILAPHGAVVVTFNNKNLRAWRALLGAIQDAGLRCATVIYQHPAVVSAKAHLARDGSYVGDFYCTFIRDPAMPDRNLEHLTEALQTVAIAHEASVPTEVVTRAALLTWLRGNFAACLFDKLDELLDELFASAHEGRRRWRGVPLGDGPRFSVALREVVTAALRNGPVPFTALYARVSAELARLGVPNPPLLKRMLEEWVTLDGGDCVAVRDEVPVMILLRSRGT